MRRDRRPLLSLLCTLACIAALAPAPAQAQPKPGTTRKVIVPLSPGGAGDRLGRILAQRLSEATGDTYIVENKPGAGGNIAASQVARAANDGATLLVVTGGMLTLNPHMFHTLPFDPLRDFTFIAKWMDSPNILFVHSSTPVRNLEELLAHARQKGQKMSFGSAGIGSSQHLAAELLKSRTGIDFIHAPYKGGSLAVRDLAAGMLDFTFSTTAAMPMMEAGRLRPLAVTSLSRLAILPDIPTIAESGYPGYEASAWYGVVAPAGLPPAETARLEAVVRQLSRDAKIGKELESDALIVDFKDSADFKRYVTDEYRRWERIIRDANIPKQ